ncbi:MAG: hypothetical protein N4J56_002021 [Chroococcidiopsis sp. SAG 2025]|uniref:O-linked N-acetylglucosamine transferase, SPINDLY family protein n=1 Tax=Chroococcidiopsis sp. SAG 2025 TaxID=171389 RepID=UPI0029373248|nr:tetratricopeptide repeat protein [Chroococcidiopsis sp. SAG 2025]MDV2992367.1 hypothetical protein [Chroococcidiopsis sp. SAG 2025]
MDYQRFLSLLPDLYDNWGRESVKPKSQQFQQILEQVGSTTTANLMQLLNLAVDCMESDEIYCEIGCFQGANLIGALFEHPDRMAYAVDNFAQFDIAGENFTKLAENLSSFSLDEQVFVCIQDWEEFLFELRAIEAENKISVYFYNGDRDYRSQILGLLLVKPFLAERALIIVCNSNGSAVRQANWDFIAAHPQCELSLDLSADDSQHPFGKSIQILSWDCARNYNYNFSHISSRHDRAFIHALDDWQSQFDGQQKTLDKLCQEAIDLEDSGQYEQAENKYNEILKLNKGRVDILHRLGMLYYKTDRSQQALDLLIKSSQLEPSNAAHHLGIGLISEKINNIPQAMQAYEIAILLAPQWSTPLINLGNIYLNVEELEKAKSLLQKALDLEPNSFPGNLYLASVFLKQYETDTAISLYQKALELQPDEIECIKCLLFALQDTGRTQEAIELAAKASQSLSDNLTLKFKSYLLLPIIYETEAEIELYRSQFAQGLNELIQQTCLASPKAKEEALIAIGNYTNFYLQYQGKNDLKFQKQYGQFVHQVMAANYPQWTQPLTMLLLSEGEKIRIGYVSHHLRNHNGAKWALGWLKNHNRQNFEIYCYYTDLILDRITKEFESVCDRFHSIPRDLEAICNQIVADKLHVIVFPDIGMAPVTTQIAGLRLAPVQCTAWGHPITSGLPTIDYYLSSDLMEPENAQEHYSEKLVRLPNLGFCYSKPAISQPTKSRLDFRLRDDAVIYLSCQSLFKYLPQYDYVYAAIAQQVSQAQFAFISHPSTYITDIFQQRLQRAFAKFGLNSQDYCVILPRQTGDDYLTLNLVSDVYLDTFSWTGGNSTMEAIACNLPVVTCPGEFMRGRHSYAMLKMLGVTDTIASDEAEYIEIAVKLGLDRDWRDSIVKQISQRHSYLYNDKTCVEALDAFFCSLV